MSQIIQSIESHNIDNETGEITSSTKTQTSRIPSEPSYIKLYIEDIAMLHSLPPSNSKILYELIKTMGYDGNIIVSKGSKELIAEKLNISGRNTVATALRNLQKSNIMSEIRDGVYMMNPELFAKGYWSDIRELRNKYINLSVTYDSKGRHIVSSVGGSTN